MTAGSHPARLGEPLPQRVAVLRALELGDFLCAVPALRALRAALPAAHVVLVGLPWAREMVVRFRRYLNGFCEFPGWPGLPERAVQIESIPRFLADLQAEQFDLAIQLHGSGSFVNELTVLFGARHCAGFYEPGRYCPDAERFMPWPTEGLEVHRLLGLMEFLGAAPHGDALEWPLSDEDFASFSAIDEARDLRPGTYCCLHPGASVPQRRWPAERFAVVATVLAARGFRIVLTGIAAERDLTQSVARQLDFPCVDLAGKTTLGAAGALLSQARLLVCNDTGVSHLAAALRVPSVVISTGGNPARWAPTDGTRHRVLCREGGVPAHEVVAAVERLLRHDGPAALPSMIQTVRA